MTHGPIDPKYREKMRAVAEALDDVFRPAGFALLIFPLNEPHEGRVNYISNANREDMLAAMKEFIARNEGRVVDTDTKQ